MVFVGKENGVFSDIWGPWKSMGLYLWPGMTVESSDEETWGCLYEILKIRLHPNKLEEQEEEIVTCIGTLRSLQISCDSAKEARQQ